MKAITLTLFLIVALLPFAQAQIPVEKDPFHSLIFENEKVRVLDLSISGTDTTTTHLHNAASVVVFMSKSKLAIQLPGAEAIITPVDAGTTLYRAYDVTPTTHKVWSADGSLMRCIIIEIKQ